MKLFPLLLCLSFISFPAYADDAANARPGWVDGNTQNQYPENKYVTAVGSGSTRETAIANAKKNLASSFRQQVVSESNSKAKSTLNENTNATTSGEASSDTQSSVQISSNVELRGVEVKEFWQDPGSKDQYALAVLDKLKIRNSYNLDLAQLRSKIEALKSNFNNKPDQKSGKALLDLAQQYQNLEKEAQMVGTPMAIGEPISATELQAVSDKLDELKNSKPVALSISAGDNKDAADEASDLQEMVAGCLQDKGYTVTDGNDAQVKLTGDFRVKSKHLKVEGFSKFEFSVKASVKKGTHTDRKMIAKEASGRELDQAFDSVKGDLSEEVCADLVQAL